MGIIRSRISDKMRTTVLLSLLFFLMMLLYVDQPFFATDEGDVFLVGTAIAKGQLLYRDISSQHMPVMYYFAAFFALFGVATISAFRVCFYLLMSAFWGLIYYRYSEKVGKAVAALYPIIYIVLIRYISLGQTILSDQMQGIGMAILFFELIVFERTRELKIGNLLMISLGVFISFGAAFTAIFGVFYVALTVVVLEMQRYRQEKLGVFKSLGKLACSYWKLVAVVAAPFIVLLLGFLFTGTLDDFFSWAYLINRQVYPKYVGYGSSVLQGFISGFSTIINTIKPAGSDISLTQIVYLFAFAGAGYFFVYIQHTRKNWILTFGLFFVLIGAATRGMFDFHGTPAVAVLSIMNAYAVYEIYKELTPGLLKKTIFLLLISALSLGYIQMIPGVFNLSIWEGTEKDPNQPSYVIDLVTDESEIVGFSTLDTNYIFESGTLPNKLSAACPWIWEWGGAEVMENNAVNPPRVYLYDPGYAIWGYPITGHAADLHAFIQENYTPLTEFSLNTVYVRNDYYEEAVKIINEDRLINPARAIPVATVNIDGNNNLAEINLTNGTGYEAIKLAVWTDLNGQDDIQWYETESLGEGNWTYTVDLANHQFYGKYNVHIYAVEEGKSYYVGALVFDYY